MSSRGEQKRAKYQDDSTNVSSVSVSRSAAAPQVGHETCFQRGWCSSGLPGFSKSMSSGSSIGKSLSGTGTVPHASQFITGIGQPQYRCREIPQSRKRKFTSRLPIPFTSKRSAIASLAAGTSKSLMKSELACTPSPVYAMSSTVKVCAS